MTRIIKGISILFFLSFSLLAISQNKDLAKTFYFGKKVEQADGIQVKKSSIYSEDKGYGFDFGSVNDVKTKKSFITANTSIYFSVQVPEGNYRVEVVLGGNKPSKTTIKAESRRLMLQEKELAKNETCTETFVVNVRSPRIDASASIKVKDRDRNQLNWDDKLTLEFLGNPAIQSIKISPAKNVTTFFLAGDSTVTDQDVEPWASWGQFFTNYLTDDVVVANYAESGSSLPAFKGALRFKKILTTMKPGDYLFIEFGHNDEKIKGEGNGAWGLYTSLLKEYATAFKSQGGHVILLTPTERRHFTNQGVLKETHGDFPDAMRKVAKDLELPLIDLTKMTRTMYQSWGNNASVKAFVHYPASTFPGQTKPLADDTHFNSFGANQVAKCVIYGIKKLNLEITQYLNTSMSNFDPEKPDDFKDWSLPMSTRFEIEKPDGN